MFPGTQMYPLRRWSNPAILFSMYLSPNPDLYAQTLRPCLLEFLHIHKILKDEHLAVGGGGVEKKREIYLCTTGWTDMVSTIFVRVGR
jgi:hypothetical protein